MMAARLGTPGSVYSEPELPAIADDAPPPSGERPSFLRLARWVAAALLLALALTLSATSLSGYLVVNGALQTVARGQGEALLQAIDRATQRGALHDFETLQHLIDSEGPHGLRCLAVLDPVMQTLATAGSCLTPAAMVEAVMTRPRSGELTPLGQRMRLVRSPPPPPPIEPVNPFGGPRPPGMPPPTDERFIVAGPLGGPALGSGPQPPDSAWATPQPLLGPRPLPPLPLLIEFEPDTAKQLRQSATRTLISGGVATLALLIAAALFWRISLREERAFAAQDRQRQLASLGEMAAVLAHELRNPLAALKGHAQLLLELLPRGARPHDKALRVVSEAERLEFLSEDLLSFVRTRSLEVQRISPAELLADCAATIGDPRIAIDVSQAPAHWLLDPARMRQVLGNLLRNAVESAPGEKPVQAAVRLDRHDLLFEIRDFGCGIADSDLEKIFEPFFTTRARGTGLGLPIARRLVALHGGQLSAKNPPGGGALFTVRLPLAAKELRDHGTHSRSR
jgi:two-component system sensor histidine kinase HydH